MNLNERITYLRNLISCISSLNCWEFDTDGKVLYSDHLDPDIRAFLVRTITDPKIFSSTLESFEEDCRPVIVSINVGLIWCAALSQNENGKVIHVIGPAMGSFASTAEMRQALRPWEYRVLETGISLNRLIERVQSLPDVSYTDLRRYSIMLHYALTDEKIGISDVRSIRTSSLPEHAGKPLAPSDRHRQWMAEESILRMVREGDLNYKSVLEKTSMMQDLWVESPGSRLESSILSCSIITVLCSRAATEGGLSADSAYHIANSYIYDLYRCVTIADTRNILMIMFDDFVKRVHRIRTEETGSAEIRNCKDYVMMHIEEPFTVSDLAERMGYASYYFTKKFKTETGIQLNEYIRKARLERSLLYLETTELPVAKIAEKLYFSSATHYTDAFRNVYGVTPAKWRREHRFR